MQINKTQQLVKALALDFIHNKSFNTSLLQLLCSQQKIHASTTIDQINIKISIIDKAFCLLKQHCSSKKDNQKKEKNLIKQLQFFETSLLKNFYNMVSIVVFNISAINEHYINQIERQMAQSTASQSNDDLNKTFQKDKMAISFLRQQLQAYYILLTEESLFLSNLINDILNQKRKAFQSELGLLQTLDYLCVKYSISNQVTQKVVDILEKHQSQIEESSSQIFSSNVVKDVNKLIFSSQKQQELYQILQSNSHVSFKNVICLINANYINTHPQRKIFNSAQLSGKQTIQGIILRIIKRINKNELFNQKSQDYTPFRLVLFYFLNKHFSVYMEFNALVKGLMHGKTTIDSEGKLNLLKKIQKIFRISIPIENPHLCSIIQFISNQLSAKYSDTLAFELIKKLLLNRFLLNPSFFILYNDSDEEEIKQYVQCANTVRALFYTNKVQELVQKTKCTAFSKVSSDILRSLEYCIKKEKDNKQILHQSSTSFLYINDKILKGQMQQLFDQIKESGQAPRQPLKQGLVLPNLVSDYSLSFSLVKNQNASRYNLSHPLLENVSDVKFPNTNRSNNLKDNQSIRHIYEELKVPRSQNQIPPKSPQKRSNPLNSNQIRERNISPQSKGQFGGISQLATKEHQITNQTRLYSMKLPTDRQMIEQLVEMRKEYGQLRKNLKKVFEQRKSRHNKKMGHLRMFSAKFNGYKEQIERENNSLYIHMTTFA